MQLHAPLVVLIDHHKEKHVIGTDRPAREGGVARLLGGLRSGLEYINVYTGWLPVRSTCCSAEYNVTMSPQMNTKQGLQNLSRLKDAERVLGCA